VLVSDGTAQDTALVIPPYGFPSMSHTRRTNGASGQIDETKAWVLLARDVGCPGVKVRPNGLRRDVPEEQSLEQIGRALRECSAFALEHGVRILLHEIAFEGFCFAEIPESADPVRVLKYFRGMFRAYRNII
jgi:sugar phosphate isomerase/epimerase